MTYQKMKNAIMLIVSFVVLIIFPLSIAGPVSLTVISLLSAIIASIMIHDRTTTLLIPLVNKAT